MKNPPEFYDMEYLHGRMSGAEGAVTRWEDNGLFFTTAMTARRIASWGDVKSVLDVGCGRGFVVRHLRNLGMTAKGVEYGKAALAHSVCGAEFGDLTEGLPVDGREHDLVLCHGVLSHIPTDQVPAALAELNRVTGKSLWSHILVKYHETQRHHRTFASTAWWTIQFNKAGFTIDRELTELVVDYNRDEYQWSAVWRRV